jgi:hypothetical protein
MVDVVVYYVIPNVLMFGGLWFVSKAIERMVWHVIENHETLMNYGSEQN